MYRSQYCTVMYCTVHYCTTVQYYTVARCSTIMVLSTLIYSLTTCVEKVENIVVLVFDQSAVYDITFNIPQQTPNSGSRPRLNGSIKE